MTAVSQLVRQHRDRLGPALAGGRIAIGVLFWVRPRESVRLAGLDAATSRSVTWLARMTAARDVALGVGGVAAYVRPRPVGSPRPTAERVAWLLAGVLADAADCAVIAGGARRGRLHVVPAAATSIGAGLTAVAGVVAVVSELTAQVKSSSG